MSTISVSLPSDGTTADVSDYNNPITNYGGGGQPDATDLASALGM